LSSVSLTWNVLLLNIDSHEDLNTKKNYNFYFYYTIQLYDRCCKLKSIEGGICSPFFSKKYFFLFMFLLFKEKIHKWMA
jgi:hypothetical protein